MAHVFSVEKVIMFAFSCWDLIVSSFTGLLTFMCCGFTRTKFMVLCFLVWVAHFESYIMLWLVLHVVALPMVIQWSFPLKGTKLLRWLYESLIMDAMFVLPGIFWRFNLLEFPVRETNARCYYLAETIVWLYTDFFWIQEDCHGQGFDLDSSVSMHFFVQNLVQRMQAYPWFDTNVGNFGQLSNQQ